jgi:hypothetical protein
MPLVPEMSKASHPPLVQTSQAAEPSQVPPLNPKISFYHYFLNPLLLNIFTNTLWARYNAVFVSNYESDCWRRTQPKRG